LLLERAVLVSDSGARDTAVFALQNLRVSHTLSEFMRITMGKKERKTDVCMYLTFVPRPILAYDGTKRMYKKRSLYNPVINERVNVRHVAGRQLQVQSSVIQFKQGEHLVD
jgi:hypothetical protein